MYLTRSPSNSQAYKMEENMGTHRSYCIRILTFACGKTLSFMPDMFHCAYSHQDLLHWCHFCSHSAIPSGFL